MLEAPAPEAFAVDDLADDLTTEEEREVLLTGEDDEFMMPRTISV